MLGRAGLFVVRVDPARRDAIAAALGADGVATAIHYPVPIHLQPAFADCGFRPGQFPVAARLACELLCLPIRPDMSAEETDYVIANVRAFFDTPKGKAS